MAAAPGKALALASVALEARAEFLVQVAEFSAVPRDALRSIASLMQEQHHIPGATIVCEEEIGDLLYVVVEGRAEVSTSSGSGRVPLATLGPKEVFGEIALLGATSRRQATVMALSSMLTLTLSRSEFAELTKQHPQLEAAFARDADARLIVKFLKTATPFREVDIQHIRKFSQYLRPILAAAGEVIVRQGEPADACYLVRSGQVEVVAVEEGGEHVLATLAAGELFGESALLTDAPRSATVRATEVTELLALHRADLIDIFGKDPMVACEVLHLQQLRARPRQAPGVVAHRATTSDGEVIVTLKDCRRYQYYRLSPAGWFVWERLDGHHTLRELALDFFSVFKKFEPQFVAEIVAGLAAAGFVETQPLRADVIKAAIRVSWLQRPLRAAAILLRWQITFENVDAIFTKLYEGGVRLVYAAPTQVALAVLGLAGLIVFLLHWARAASVLPEEVAGSMLLWLLPAYLLSIVFHEAGHAFTAKAWGREVPRAGIGLYWFEPIAFVDTSDMWLAPRRQRIAVSLAGLYADMILAGLAALAASILAHGQVATALWLFSVTSYLLVFINLNPLAEFDGYYVLMDWLERPNLRSRALTWLGREFFAHGHQLRGHTVDLVYSIAALVYVVFATVATVAALRETSQRWIAPHSSLLAHVLQWAGALFVVVICTLGLVTELRASPKAEAAEQLQTRIP
jgi:putative peptide zinc metalloprotease protein